MKYKGCDTINQIRKLSDDLLTFFPKRDPEEFYQELLDGIKDDHKKDEKIHLFKEYQDYLEKEKARKLQELNE